MLMHKQIRMAYISRVDVCSPSERNKWIRVRVEKSLPSSSRIMLYSRTSRTQTHDICVAHSHTYKHIRSDAKFRVLLCHFSSPRSRRAGVLQISPSYIIIYAQDSASLFAVVHQIPWHMACRTKVFLCLCPPPSSDGCVLALLWHFFHPFPGPDNIYSVCVRARISI